MRLPLHACNCTQFKMESPPQVKYIACGRVRHPYRDRSGWLTEYPQSLEFIICERLWKIQLEFFEQKQEKTWRWPSEQRCSPDRANWRVSSSIRPVGAYAFAVRESVRPSRRSFDIGEPALRSTSNMALRTSETRALSVVF